jgi:hypothetical protein
MDILSDKSVMCWVGGSIYVLHIDQLKEAKEKGIDWIREATEEEIRLMNRRIVIEPKKNLIMSTPRSPDPSLYLGMVKEFIEKPRTVFFGIDPADPDSDFTVKCKAFPNGIPCDHPGCLNHIHPCEVCGRINGRNVGFNIIEEEKENKP